MCIRDRIFCRKPGAKALPADWTAQCLTGTDPRTLDPKDVPRLPQVAQCPSERTRSSVTTSDDEPAAAPREERERSGCGCGTAKSEPVSVGAAVLALLACGRRVKRRGTAHAAQAEAR